MQPQQPVTEQPKSSLLRTIKMVAWSFIGLRKGSEFEQDIKMNPLHIVAVGIAETRAENFGQKDTTIANTAAMRMTAGSYTRVRARTPVFSP